jgi:hypothetical protein
MLRRHWFKGLIAVFVALSAGFIVAAEANAAGWTEAGQWGVCATSPGPPPENEPIPFCLLGAPEHECFEDDQCGV